MSYEIVIIGSGPAGLSAAAHAAKLGVAHVLLEAGAQPSNTIYKYQKGKHVMAEPQILPLRSPLTFAAGKRVRGARSTPAEAGCCFGSIRCTLVRAILRADQACKRLLRGPAFCEMDRLRR